MAERSYYYVFLADVTGLDRDTRRAFDEFERAYAGETEVFRYYPSSPEFRAGRSGFGIGRIPGFAISDTRHEIGEGFRPNPFISVERGFLEGRGFDELFNLVRDWHDRVLAEDVLRLGRDKILEQSTRLFGRVWEGVREAANVVSAAT